MTPEQIIQRLLPRIQNGLLTVKDLVINEADPWIPIDTAKLRRSADFEFEGDTKLIIRYGSGLKYARAQYYGFTDKAGPRHVLQSGQPIKLIDAVQVGGKTGRKMKNRYQSAYRIANKEKLLKYMSGFGGQPKWLHRVMADTRFRKKLVRAFVRTLKR